MLSPVEHGQLPTKLAQVAICTRRPPVSLACTKDVIHTGSTHDTALAALPSNVYRMCGEIVNGTTFVRLLPGCASYIMFASNVKPTASSTSDQ